MDGDADYGYDCVVDVPATRFTVVAEGRTTVVSAYALDFGDSNCPGADEAARAKLAKFQNKLAGLESWLPEGSIGAEQTFSPDAVRLYVTPYARVDDPALTQSPVDWPLSTPLSRIGEPVKNFAEYRCVALEGDEAARFLSVAQSTNQLTPWRSDGERFALVIRPLLPDESGC